jgi:hypothetical protein
MLNKEEALSNWLNMNNALRTATEEECFKLLLHEKENRQRLAFMLRIYGRYNQLRAQRERMELFNTAKGAKKNAGK